MRYTVEITDVLNWNGITCSPDKTNIVFEQPVCGDIVCIKSQGVIEIETPDGCTEKCFYGIVSCDDDCDDCGDREIKICPCVNNSDCDNCSSCDPATHVCVSRCPKGEICSESCGGCAECDENNPCTNGRSCQNCKCECPTGRPFTNANGNCVDCIDRYDCPEGQVCTPDGCKPVLCTDGVYNKDLDKCVECNSRADCKKPNECCVGGNKCDCCPGFVRNSNGDCVPAPDCKFDTDCKDCEFCDIAGGSKCKPILCPPGTICVGGGCVDICDCDEPLCDSNNACVRVDGSICGCKKCEGNCANGESCGEGCYCDKSGPTPVCRANPCSGGCKDGTDCGPGCGCNEDTLQCEPCSGEDCGQGCNKLLGCGCPDGEKCVDIPNCGNECINGIDCPNNCGCDDAICESCSNYSCEDCPNIDGCKCDETTGFKCVGDPDRSCKDKATLVKDDSNCSLKATFDIKKPCSCPVITAGVVPTAFNTSAGSGGPANVPNKLMLASFRVELRKGNVTVASLFKNAPLLNDLSNENIVSNELPETGNVRIRTYAVYKEPVPIELGGGYKILPAILISEQSKSIGNLALVEFTNISFGNYLSGNNILYSSYVVFDTTSSLDFPNQCSYDHGFLFKMTNTFVENNGVYTQSGWVLNTTAEVKALQSDSERNPELFWHKVKPGEAFTKDKIFRKVYAGKGTDGKYFDILYGPGEIPDGIDSWPLSSPEGEFWNGYNYKVSSDCSCDEATINDPKFCNVEKLEYKIDASLCQTQIQVTKPFVPCPINDDLTKFENATYSLLNPSLVTGGYAIPDEAQTSFKIFFNDKLAHQWVGDLAAGFIIKSANSETIEKVAIVQYINGVEVCRKTYNHPLALPTPDIKFECNASGDQNKIRVTTTQFTGSILISAIQFGLGSSDFKTGEDKEPVYTGPIADYNHQGIFTNPVVKDIPKTITTNKFVFAKVTFTSGCSKVYKLGKCTASVTGEPKPNKFAYSECIPAGANPNIEITATGFGPGVKYSLNNGPLQVGNVFTNIGPGTYTIFVTDGTDEGVTTVDVVVPETPDVFLEDESICINGSTNLVINAPSGTTFNITTPLNTINNAIIVNGTYVLPINYAPGVDGNYVVTLVSSPDGSVCSAFTKTVVLTVGGTALNPQIESSPGSYCVGDPIPFRIVNAGTVSFKLKTNGTGSVNAILQGSSDVYNGVYIPSVPNGQIQIDGLAPGISNECNTTTLPVLNITSSLKPIISNQTSVCEVNNTATITVYTVNATSVKIENVNATETAPGSGIWVRTNVVGITSASISATNGSCTATSSIDVQDCSLNCSGTLYIKGDNNICSAGPVDFDYDNFVGQTPDGTWTYKWQTLSGVNYIDATLSAAFNPLSLPTFNYALNQNSQITARLVMTNTINSCVYNSAPKTIMCYPLISTPTITMSPSVVLVGQTATFSAPQGYSNYQWKVNGSNVGTNQNTYQYIPNIAGTPTITVDVTDINGCTATVSQGFTFGVNCPLVPVSYVPSGNCSDIQLNVTNNIGAMTYAVAGTGTFGTVINVVATPLPNTNVILVPTVGLVPGEQVLALDVTFVYTQGANPQCTVTTSVALNYARCANGCNCIFDIEVTDTITGLPEIVSGGDDIVGDVPRLYYRADITTVKTCDGIPTQTLETILDQKVVTKTAYLSVQHPNLLNVSNPITSIDVISNSLPVTLAIPAFWNGGLVSGNPQTTLAVLVDYLNFNTTGSGTFETYANFPAIAVKTTNTRGFDIAGQFVQAGVSYNIGYFLTGGVDINHTYQSGICGPINYRKQYITSVGASFNLGVNFDVTYNTLVALTDLPEIGSGNSLLPNNVPYTCANCS